MIIVPPERRIYITSDMTEESTTEIIQAIHRLDVPKKIIGKRESEEKLEQFSIHSDPIEIVIDSYGGEMYSMFAIYDTIKQASCPVHTLALGKVMSAAVLLLAAGEKGRRRSGKNTTFMIHQASITDMNGKQSSVEDYVKHISKLDKAFYREMLSLSIKTENWEQICKENDDYYFNAVAAMGYGIIDEII